MADLQAKVGSLDFATPVIAASGTYGYGLEYDGLVDWSGFGGVSVKGLSLNPSQGLPAPRMVETSAGMLNAIGLQNIGTQAFLTEKLPRLRELPVRVIANVWGNSPEDYEAVVIRLADAEGIDAIEINLACPNKKEWGTIFACDPAVVARVTAAVRKLTHKPLWVKLTPNVSDISGPAKAAAGEGADAVSLINTLRGMAIDAAARQPRLSNTTGGLSGPAIKPVGLLMTYEASRAVDIPVVGGGGIASGEDVAEYLLAGASAVQVGTANLFDPAAPVRISRELDAFLRDQSIGSARELVGALEPVVV